MVHLSSADDASGIAGTRVELADGQPLPAMRLSFLAAGKTWIYDPGLPTRARTPER